MVEDRDRDQEEEEEEEELIGVGKVVEAEALEQEEGGRSEGCRRF